MIMGPLDELENEYRMRCKEDGVAFDTGVLQDCM